MEPITVVGVIHDGLVVAISSQPPNDTSEPIERVPDALGAPTGTEVRLVSKAVFENGEVWMCNLILETSKPGCGGGIKIVGIGLEAFGETETFFGGPDIWSVEPITVVGVIHDGVVVAISFEAS